MTSAKNRSVEAFLHEAAGKAIEIERFGEVLDEEQFEAEMFMQVEETIEYFEENAHQLSSFDYVVMEMARVHIILNKMRPWPIEANEMLLNFLLKVKNRSVGEIHRGARSAINNVLELLNDDDRTTMLEEQPTLLDDVELPSDAKTPKSPRINNVKIRVEAAIHTIRDRDREAARPESWKHLSAKQILEVVNENKTMPNLSKKQIVGVINRADHEALESHRLMKWDDGSKVKTGTEWICGTTQKPNKRSDYNRRLRTKMTAAGICICSKPLDIPGKITCSTCLKAHAARHIIRVTNMKADWSPLCQTQQYGKAYARIEPVIHRESLEFYVAESEKLVGQAVKEIKELELSEETRHKAGMTEHVGRQRDIDYKTHSTELKNSMSWTHEDVNVVTLAEIGLAFELRKLFKRESDNSVYQLGHYTGPRFANENGSLIEGTLYFRYN